MEEELEMNEEQAEEIVEEVVSTDESVSSTTMTDEILHLAPVSEETLSAISDDTTSYVGDDDSTSTGSAEEESSNDKWGSLDCRSECKYNTGDRSKYANYGYSD